LIAAAAVSLFFWARIAKRDSRLLYIWLSALVGAFAGAKLVYILAEGWLSMGHPDLVLRWLTGKSVLGALLGGYASVEIAKKHLGYRSATGDWFAMMVPFGIAWGRVGCWFNGCCQGQVVDHVHWWTVKDAGGVPRWPSVPIEGVFNLIAGVSLILLRRQQRFPGNLFHLYLMAYGTFRFVHEFYRDTPRMVGPFSGYAIAALALVCLGAIRFKQRLGAHE
jgi:phosphatidylglycerol:prolipoprotein diacylglycerol transferase